MKRRWNWLLWAGFLASLAAPIAHVLVFVWHPATRDFPWAALLIFAAGAVLLAMGLQRAFAKPAMYRGKIFGSVLAVLALAVFGMFSFGLFYIARDLPPSAHAPEVGQKAPAFSLPDQNEQQVTLAQLLSTPVPGMRGTNPRGVLLIFYRGHW